MFYIFHGEDEFSRSEELSRLKAQVMEQGLGDLNITTLDGRRLAMEELIHASNTLPFLTNRRLVIVEDLLQRLAEARPARSGKGASGGSDDTATLLGYLPNLPPTTRLVFVETKSLSPSHPVLKAAQGAAKGFVRHFALFDLRRDRDARSLQEWIRRRAQDKGSSISPQTADYLIELVGNDLRALDRELEKLAALADYTRNITIEDVRALVSAAREADVFALVDALGMRQRQEALRLVGRLLAEDKNELYLLTMIARQVRLLLTAKEMAEERQAPVEEIGKALGVRSSFIVHKLLQQSKQFQTSELETLLSRMLDLDQALKTGRMEGALGLELLILEICQRHAAPAGAAHQGNSRSRTR